MLTDRYFWFIQPSSVLSLADKVFGYIFLGLVIAAIVSRLLVSFNKNEIDRKLFRKIWHLAATIGIIGLIWFGLRFENTYIIGQRWLAGLNSIIGIIWMLFVLKYIIFNYPSEKFEYNRELVKSKYIPGSRPGLPKQR